MINNSHAHKHLDCMAIEKVLEGQSSINKRFSRDEEIGIISYTEMNENRSIKLFLFTTNSFISRTITIKFDVSTLEYILQHNNVFAGFSRILTKRGKKKVKKKMTFFYADANDFYKKKKDLKQSGP